MNLQNKIALITGATSGIGHAAARRLAHAGAAVVLGARRQEAGETLASQIRDSGGRAHFQITDVTAPGAIESLVAAAEEHFGGLDIAVNNAGIEGAGIVPLADDTEQNLRDILEVNTIAVWRSMHAEIPAMRRRGGGSIINTSSVAGHKGFGGFSAYCASKFAVEGLTRSVAQEVGPDRIRVNSIQPGPITTEMLDRTTGGDHSMFADAVPLGRTGSADEVAELILFLASDQSAYVNGDSIRIDGGMVS